MKKIVSSFITILMATSSYAAVPQKTIKKSDQALYQQLTGQKYAPPVNKKVSASAEKALGLARQSRQQKDYIQALKRYNFVLKYYAKTPQAKMALADKASMYKEMGLPEQAAYNQKRISLMDKTTIKRPLQKQATIKKSIEAVKK